MAELPELETLRRELEKESVGKRFKSPEVNGAKVTKRNGNKKVFQGRLEGAKVKSVDRRGPFLVGNLDNGELLLIDLGEKGYLEKVAPKSTAPKGTAVTFAFTQGGQIRLVDPSGTAQAFVVATDAVAEEVPELAAGGLDPVADAVSWTSFARAILAKNVKLKALLMDPEVVAGIGSIYSDEILWESGLRHDRISSELSSQEIRRLFRALVETLHEAVKHRGTTVPENAFVDLYGKEGDYQDLLKVYGREGEPCRRCRAPVAKVRYANKPLYYCDACQV
jgi:formamidopyrimidine-DNA glycosylase